MINGIKRETRKNDSNFQKKTLLFDRKLTPEPLKKTVEIKRNLTPSRNPKNSQKTLPHQLFIKKNNSNVNSLPHLPIENSENGKKGAADVKKFEKLFQSNNFLFKVNQLIFQYNLIIKLYISYNNIKN